MKVYLTYNGVQQSTDIFRNEFVPSQMVRISDRDKGDDETSSLIDQLRACKEIVEDIPVDNVRAFDCEESNWLFTELVAKHGLTR